MPKNIDLPVELLLGTLLLLIVVGLGAFVWIQATQPLPTEEVCDLEDNDRDGEVDEGFSVTCTKDADCGPSGPYGEPYCKDGDVYSAYYQNRCAGEKGSCLSECVSQQTEKRIEECEDGCASGACTP